MLHRLLNAHAHRSMEHGDVVVCRNRITGTWDAHYRPLFPDADWHPIPTVGTMLKLNDESLTPWQAMAILRADGGADE